MTGHTWSILERRYSIASHTLAEAQQSPCIVITSYSDVQKAK